MKHCQPDVRWSSLPVARRQEERSCSNGGSTTRCVIPGFKRQRLQQQSTNGRRRCSNFHRNRLTQHRLLVTKTRPNTSRNGLICPQTHPRISHKRARTHTHSHTQCHTHTVTHTYTPTL